MVDQKSCTSVRCQKRSATFQPGHASTFAVRSAAAHASTNAAESRSSATKNSLFSICGSCHSGLPSGTMTSTEKDLSQHAQIAERIIGNIVQAKGPVVSPDGSSVAFVVSRVDMVKKKNFTQVWLAAADGSTPPQPATGGEFDTGPAWTPDGRSLAFASRRSAKKGESTLHVLPVASSGETRTIATMKEAVRDISWTRDGRWIAFVSRTPDERYEAEDESWQAPRRIERFFSKLDNEGWTFDRPSHV